MGHASSTAPEDYFLAASKAFEAAASRWPAQEIDIQAGEERVRIRFAGPELVPILSPALEHRRLDRAAGLAQVSEEPALTICAFDSESTGTPMPPPAWDHSSYARSGEILGFNTERIRTLYQPGADVFHMYDRDRRQAIYWVKRASIIPYWETSFAFRTILHWWTIGRPYQLMHAGAVGYAHGGVLIAGPSGSGKTTSTLACIDSSLGYIGDDYLMVGVNSDSAEGPSFYGSPRAFSLYNTAKMLPDSLQRLPALSQYVTNRDKLENEKAMVFFHQSLPGKVLASFPIRAILTPRVTGERDTRLKPGSAMTSLRALLPTTLLHLPGGAEGVRAKIAALVRQVPNYALEAGEDLRQIPKVIEELLSVEIR
jgi:hypothetical protein